MFLSIRRHASRGYGFSSIILVVHAFFVWFIAEYIHIYIYIITIMFGFRQSIQVEERTTFCLHSIFESL